MKRVIGIIAASAIVTTSMVGMTSTEASAASRPKVKTYTVSGTAFHDINRNGKLDKTDIRIDNTWIRITNLKGKKISTVKTNAYGNYAFKVPTGTYKVKYYGGIAATAPVKTVRVKKKNVNVSLPVLWTNYSYNGNRGAAGYGIGKTASAYVRVNSKFISDINKSRSNDLTRDACLENIANQIVTIRNKRNAYGDLSAAEKAVFANISSCGVSSWTYNILDSETSMSDDNDTFKIEGMVNFFKDKSYSKIGRAFNYNESHFVYILAN